MDRISQNHDTFYIFAQRGAKAEVLQPPHPRSLQWLFSYFTLFFNIADHSFKISFTSTIVEKFSLWRCGNSFWTTAIQTIWQDGIPLLLCSIKYIVLSHILTMPLSVLVPEHFVFPTFFDNLRKSIVSSYLLLPTYLWYDIEEFCIQPICRFELFVWLHACSPFGLYPGFIQFSLDASMVLHSWQQNAILVMVFCRENLFWDFER